MDPYILKNRKIINSSLIQLPLLKKMESRKFSTNNAKVLHKNQDLYAV